MYQGQPLEREHGWEGSLFLVGFYRLNHKSIAWKGPLEVP